MLNKKIIFLTNVLWNLFKMNTHKNVWDKSEGENISEEKTLAVFLIFTVLVALLAPTNASAYTKLGYVMTKSSAKKF